MLKGILYVFGFQWGMAGDCNNCNWWFVSAITAIAVLPMISSGVRKYRKSGFVLKVEYVSKK